MLLSSANLLLLDEPTNHLDLAARSYLQEALRHFDGGVLLASHDRHFAANLATRLLSIEGSSVRHLDDYGAYLTSLPAIEAKAHSERADADRRRLDVQLGASSGPSAAAAKAVQSSVQKGEDLEANQAKVGRRAAARKRRGGDGAPGKAAVTKAKAVVSGAKKKRAKGVEPFWKGAKR